MSLLLARLGGAVADEKLYADFTEEFQLSFEYDFEFSFFSGPLSDDAVVVLDQVVNTFEDDEPADEADYSFAFTLTDDAQGYAAQFEREEDPDEAEYDFAAGPLSDDFVAPDEKVYSAALDDGEAADDGDGDFAFTLLDDAQVMVGLDENESAEDQGEEFSLALMDEAQIPLFMSDEGEEPGEVEDGLFLGPLSDDFAVAAEDQFQYFDEYEENDENEYSFYLGILGDDAAPVEIPVPAGGDDDQDGTWWRSPRRKKAKGRATTRPTEAQLKSEKSGLPQPAAHPAEAVIPSPLARLKAEIAFEVDEILRQQARIDREERRKGGKQARAARVEGKKQEFARIEGERQRLAEEALAARLRAIDDDDAIILAMSI